MHVQSFRQGHPIGLHGESGGRSRERALLKLLFGQLAKRVRNRTGKS
jgi:hypothetical protein